MTKNDLSRSISEINNTFPSGGNEEAVCLYVIDKLSSLGPSFQSLTLGGVAADLGWTTNPERCRAIATALDFLAGSAVSILERRFELWAPETSWEILEEPICELSNADIRLALEQNNLINPCTGEPVSRFMDYVTVVYVVRDSAKKATFLGASV